MKHSSSNSFLFVQKMPETVEVCRLCLSKERFMFPIFPNHVLKDETSFRTKVMSCASIEIFADDNLPSKVCYLCVYQVEKFFQFQEMCENSDLVLRSQLKEAKILDDIDQDDESMFSMPDTEKFNDKYHTMANYYSNNFTNKEKKLNFETLTCNICASVFLTNNLLIDHLIKNHSDLNLFFCKSCKIAFSHVNHFKRHFTLQHSLRCNHCSCVFKCEKNLKDHLKFHNGENLVCRYCDKTFHIFYELKKHELIHSEKKCSYCTKEIDSKTGYRSHISECDQKYHCKFCKETFKKKKELIEHVNNLHDSSEFEKLENCQETPSTVQSHKSENEDKSFGCKNCQLQDTYEIPLENQKPVEHSSVLLTCRFCGKKFSLRSSLKRHEKSHSGVKPYQCKFCPRKFKDSSACVVHTRTHTGERPFRCQECHKDFKQLANLKMHTFRHHKKNKKYSEVKPDVLNENSSNYVQYSEGIIQNFSGENLRNYQDLNETISATFNILIPNHPSS